MSGDAAASAAALILAAVFVWAASAKIGSLGATAASFAELGLVAPSSLAPTVAALELLAAGLLVRVPVVGAGAALFLLVAFSVVLVRAISSGLVVSCACFGGTADRVISPLDVARNVGLAILAQFALFAPWPIKFDAGSWGLVSAGVAVGALSLRMARRQMSGR